eukprot:GHVN01000191.1.p1 GENE.GHVN01000191.1~~GHVN01000191.1.p1  ORF type:complete len:123 (+),score=12.40 GHVN01000191.1:32-370(+)
MTTITSTAIDRCSPEVTPHNIIPYFDTDTICFRCEERLKRIEQNKVLDPICNIFLRRYSYAVPICKLPGDTMGWESGGLAVSTSLTPPRHSPVLRDYLLAKMETMVRARDSG